MKSLFAFLKKEWLETVRSGKIIILVILFVLFGIMNPAIAKLTPWMMELMAPTLAETGMMVIEIQVDALTSWTQFFKNIPMGLIAFVLIYSSTFTKEYQLGTLVLVLTKGLLRYKVVLAKSALMFSMWTVCFWTCVAVTYGYNAYFWDNSIAHNLFTAMVCWWLFGVWTVSLLVLFSVACRTNTGVLLGAVGMVLVAYVVGIFPGLQEYTPIMLMNASALLSDAIGLDSYVKAIVVTIVLSVACIAVSIPMMNKKQI